ncbi:MAG: hypothetical protein RRC07_02265 [Anaerolineae bacterium]|nr:hypothetical protein [Anaerolineae bacterium]
MSTRSILVSSSISRHEGLEPLPCTWQTALLWTLRAVLMLTIVAETLSGDYLWAADALLALALCSLPSALFRNYDRASTLNIEIVFLAMAVGNCTLGVAGNLYRSLPYYDKVLHIINPAALAYCSFVFMWTIVSTRDTGISPLALAAVTTLMVLGASAIWELAEYVSDQLASTSTQGSPLLAPLDDTMWDLLLSFFGGLLGAVAAALSVLSSRHNAHTQREGKGWLS